MGSMVSGAKDLLFGKNQKAGMVGQDKVLATHRRKAVRRYTKQMEDYIQASKNPAQFERGEMLREQRAIGQGAEDSKRKLQEMMARRGMGGSSIGIGQALNIDRDVAEKKALLGAGLARRKREAELNRIKTIMGMQQLPMGLTPGGTYQQGGRQGGIASAIGAAAGGYYGGAAGAKAGAGIAESIGSVI